MPNWIIFDEVANVPDKVWESFRKKEPPVARYYAQYQHEPGRDPSVVENRGWIIFDRMLHFGAGDDMVVGKFYNRDVAFKIRDLLNEDEDKKRNKT